MIEPRTSNRRYMDFVGPRRASATDPLISRPVSRSASRVADLGDPLANKSLVSQPKPSAPARRSAETILPSGAAPRSRHLSRAPIRPVSASRPASTLTPLSERRVASNPKTSSVLIPTSKSSTLAQISKTSTVAVKQTEEKALISRKPSTAPKEYFPTLLEDEPSDLQIKATDHPHDDVAKKASSALSGTSPFLSNYNVDKRPLSSSVPDKKSSPYEKVSYLGVNNSASDSPRRKKLSEEEAEDEFLDEKGKKPEKIIDKTPASVIPTVVIILVTIVLGAAAGAGVYFLLPK